MFKDSFLIPAQPWCHCVHMNAVDYLILIVLAISMLLGMYRGFVRESIGLLSWLGGLWLAWRYAPLVEPLLGGSLSEEPVRTWAARTLIVVAVVLVGWLVAAVLGYLVRHSGLSLTVDRLLGMVFGVLRGAVVIAALVLLAQFAQLDQVKWWKKSLLLPYASECAGWIEAFAETGMRLLEEQAQLPHSLPAPSPLIDALRA
jgi:membrane protein required for colicin V production